MEIAICQDCDKEMMAAENCIFPMILIDGTWFDRDTSGCDDGIRCHDCGIIKEDNVHHFGCDMERCPKCGGQLISCYCKKEMVGKKVF